MTKHINKACSMLPAFPFFNRVFMIATSPTHPRPNLQGRQIIGWLDCPNNPACPYIAVAIGAFLLVSMQRTRILYIWV
jgi:hypothetical protein